VWFPPASANSKHLLTILNFFKAHCAVQILCLLSPKQLTEACVASCSELVFVMPRMQAGEIEVCSFFEKIEFFRVPLVLQAQCSSL
jgi:hypothetical protein